MGCRGMRAEGVQAEGRRSEVEDPNNSACTLQPSAPDAMRDYSIARKWIGLFAVAGVPPGKHEISFWHETLGALTKQVTVPPQGELSVTFQYP